jgi:hypothetical protein
VIGNSVPDRKVHAAFRADWFEDSGEQKRYNGSVQHYSGPFSGYSSLGDEAAWFADCEAVAQKFAWSKLVAKARHLDRNGLAVLERLIESVDPLLDTVEYVRLDKLGVSIERGVRNPGLLLPLSLAGRDEPT